jgi:hypothetical protein
MGVTEQQGVSWGEQSGVSEQHSESHGVTESEVQSRGRSVSQSEGGFQSHTVTHGQSDTESEADGIQESWGESHAESQMQGLALGRGGYTGFAGGFSAGLIPGVSIGRSWQVEDDVADRLTEVMRGLEGLLNQASAEGGFLTDAYLFTASARGTKAAAALIPRLFTVPMSPRPY